MTDDTFVPMPEERGWYVVIPGDYALAIQESGPNLIVVLGALVTDEAYNFTHNNLLRRVDHKFEFKHYHANGSKSWTSKPGRYFAFIVPRSAIMVKRKCGYSYPEVRINGHEFRLNVSGGSGGRDRKEWTDYISEEVHASVGHPLADYEALAEVALEPPIFNNFRFYWEQDSNA